MGDDRAYEKGKSLGIELNEFVRIRLVIALRFALETFLNRLLDLSQTFEAVLQRLESLIGTVMRGKFLEPGAFQYAIDRWSAYPAVFCQVRYLPEPGLIKPPDFLAI